MDLGSPVRDIAPAVRGALLQALARLEQPVPRRRLAAAAGVAPGNASSVIEELIKTGLVSDDSRRPIVNGRTEPTPPRG